MPTRAFDEPRQAWMRPAVRDVFTPPRLRDLNPRGADGIHIPEAERICGAWFAVNCGQTNLDRNHARFGRVQGD
jgi:hypothetical protein